MIIHEFCLSQFMYRFAFLTCRRRCVRYHVILYYIGVVVLFPIGAVRRTHGTTRKKIKLEFHEAGWEKLGEAKAKTWYSTDGTALVRGVFHVSRILELERTQKQWSSSMSFFNKWFLLAPLHRTAPG